MRAVGSVTARGASAPDRSLFVVGRGVSPPPSPREPVLEGPLSLSAHVEYSTWRRGSPDPAFGLLTVRAKPTAGRQPLDIVCVVDVSGSMGGEKITLVQDALRFMIKESQEKDRLSIVAFNTRSWKVLRVRGLDVCGKMEAKTAVTSLATQVGGGTCIASGIRVAVDVVEQRPKRNPVSAIMLLTDGRDDAGGDSRAVYAQLLKQLERSACPIYLFGFGADHDARLLADLAELAQTPFTYVEDMRAIRAAFAGTIGGLASVVAQNVEVTLRGRVSLTAVQTPFTVTQDGTGGTVVQIPDMLAGERRDLVVQMGGEPPDADAAADEFDGEVVLLEASARYLHLAAGGAPTEADPVKMRQRRVAWGEAAEPDPEPDPEVVTQRNRVEVTQALQEAAALADAGSFEEALALLAAHEEGMRGRGLMSPMDEGLMLELVDARERMRDRETWEMGGMAEVRDAMQMHRMQRATNASGSDAPSGKNCKAMYLTPQQREWLSKLT